MTSPSIPGTLRAPIVTREAAVLAGVVVLLGLALVVKPILVVVVLGLALFAAVASIPGWLLVSLLVAVTAIVPYGLQNQYGIGAGAGSPGLILSDVLLVAAVLMTAPWLLGTRHPPRARAVFVLVLFFLALCGTQFVRGFFSGRSPSDVGAEFRTMLGFAALLPAYRVLASDRRHALIQGLAVAGILLGTWGLAQWTLNIEFAGARDVGVREGVRFTTAGRGQLQGGLFAFPVAILLALAALVSGRLQTTRAMVVALVIVLLNALSLLLTFERTFWVATLLGGALIVMKAGRAQRARAGLWGVAVLMVFFAVLATLLPGELTAARERLLSLSQYGNDRSIHYRLAESRHVTDEIRQSPLIGSGFGASIFWGRPWERVPPSSFTYSHNGYLWLAWKIGIPAALLLLAAIALCLRGGRARGPDPLFSAVRDGAQASLVALLLISVTFPSFSQLMITPTIGLLLAICVTRQRPVVSPSFVISR